MSKRCKKNVCEYPNLNSSKHEDHRRGAAASVNNRWNQMHFMHWHQKTITSQMNQRKQNNLPSVNFKKQIACRSSKHSNHVDIQYQLAEVE